MARERVNREQNHVAQQNQSPNPDSYGAVKEEGVNGVAPEKNEEEHGQIEKVAMDILKNERKCGFTAIAMPAFAHCASGRVQKECAIVGFAVVIAGYAESQRAGQNQ